MTQSSQQFTAAQVLEAGQRAEADGRRDYALQFYHYLIETYANTAEAIYAREALNRLSPPQVEPAAQGVPQTAPVPVHQSAAPAPVPVYTGFVPAPLEPAPAANGGPVTYDHQLPQGNGAVDPYAANFPMPSVVKPDRGELAQAGSYLLPVPHERYRAGRVIATAVSVIGWLVILLGLGASVLGSGLVAGPAAIMGYVPGLIYSAGSLALGLGMIFSGQLARAVFDNANATRDLVAIEHAKARQSQPL